MLDKFPSRPVRAPLPLSQPASLVSRSALPPVSSPVNASASISAVSVPSYSSEYLRQIYDDNAQSDANELVNDLLATDADDSDDDSSATNAEDHADILTGRLPADALPRAWSKVPSKALPVIPRLRPRLVKPREFSIMPADTSSAIVGGSHFFSGLDNTRAFSTGSIWELEGLAEGTIINDDSSLLSSRYWSAWIRDHFL